MPSIARCQTVPPAFPTQRPRATFLAAPTLEAYTFARCRPQSNLKRARAEILPGEFHMQGAVE
jgi:hypothetical protein